MEPTPCCISIPAPGGYERLRVESLPQEGHTSGANVRIRGVSAEDCVVVDVHAAGVNYADVCVRWGLYESARKFVGWPITPGFEFSGVVVRAGRNASAQFRAGDRVFGVTLFGAYSTRVAVPRWQLFPLPEQCTMDEAAGFPAGPWPPRPRSAHVDPPSSPSQSS